MRVIRRSIGNVAAVIFLLSAFVHTATYFQINLSEEYPEVWALFPAALAIHILACIYLASRIGARPGPSVMYNATLARMPKWTWAVMAAFFTYLLVSVALFGTGIVVPEFVNGKYIIFNHGFITEYTVEETQLLLLYRLRVVSEFWMWMTLIWGLFCLTASPDPLMLDGVDAFPPASRALS